MRGRDGHAELCAVHFYAELRRTERGFGPFSETLDGA